MRDDLIDHTAWLDPNWRDWRTAARERLFHHVDDTHAWDDGEFQTYFENGLTPAEAVQRYLDVRHGALLDMHASAADFVEAEDNEAKNRGDEPW